MTYKKNKNNKRNEDTGTSIVERTKRAAKISKRLKIIVGYFQLLSAAEASYSIPWPDALFQFFMLLLPINFDLVSVTGLDCISEYDWYSSFHVMMSAPIGVVLFVTIIHLLGKIYLKKSLKKHFTKVVRHTYEDKAVQFILWCILIAYPPVSKKSLEFFQCSESIVEINYMQVDYRLECFDDKWMSYLPIVIACVLIYPLGVPLFLFLKLWTNRHNINDDEITKFESRYSFFYSAYKDESFMWDVVELVRKLLLTAVIILIKPGSDSQTIVGFLVTLFFLLLLLKWSPFRSKTDGNVAMASQVALTITMLFGVLLKTGVLHREEWNIEALGLCLLIMNGGVVLFVVTTLVALCYQNVKSKKDEKKKKAKRTKSKSLNKLFSQGTNGTKVIPIQKSQDSINLKNWKVGKVEIVEKNEEDVKDEKDDKIHMFDDMDFETGN